MQIGKCRAIETSKERNYCLDEREVPEKHFEGNGTLLGKNQQIMCTEKAHCNVAGWLQQRYDDIIAILQSCNNARTIYRFFLENDG